MDVLITLVALGAVATVSYMIYNKSKKTNTSNANEWSYRDREDRGDCRMARESTKPRETNSGSANEWVSRDQKEESYRKTIETFIQVGRWEDLERLKTSLAKYPRLIQRIEEALKNRK